MMSTTEYLFLYSEENAGHFMYPKQVSIQLVSWTESPVAKTTETGRDCALSVLRWHSSHCPHFKKPLFHRARVLPALASSISGLTTLFCTWHSALSHACLSEPPCADFCTGCSAGRRHASRLIFLSWVPSMVSSFISLLSTLLKSGLAPFKHSPQDSMSCD